ncbi:hypothetical protein SK128_007996 [Halocaridina rubra]|uniref:Uncharacterized protein n=1 Tax=Halocaridina rubra TaxID=373956 RepID=A0AAN8WHQ0_HALRR
MSILWGLPTILSHLPFSIPNKPPPSVPLGFHWVVLFCHFLTARQCFGTGRLLAHEWLQYRYGVFEEAGWVESPIHPAHYRASDGEWRPNACANVPLTPNPLCHPKNLSCPYKIEQEDSSELTKSFMAFPELPSVYFPLSFENRCWRTLGQKHDLGFA